MKIIGCMSGTSLDGLDLALCEFLEDEGDLNFKILKAKTYTYPSLWKRKLKNAHLLSGLELSQLDVDYGNYIGQSIIEFIQEFQITNIQYIASHGHTVFHQPEKQLTLQIGNGVNIATKTNITVVNDFRSLDVSLNGQGAPLVPIGDELLFSEFDYCLNLGGFSNVSYRLNGSRIAFDISPANLILNKYAELLGLEFDNGGQLGRSGEIIPELLVSLNSINYYQKPFPKSLGREWLEHEFYPLLPSNRDTKDILRTLYEHIAIQIGSILKLENTKTLITGGGALNDFLIELIKNHSNSKIVIPNHKTIDFKEALVFAFLAYLRINNKINVLKSVTGAKSDSCSGNIIYS